MLVLPTSTAPALRKLLDHVRVVGRDEIREHPRAAVVRIPPSSRTSLCAIGTPVSGRRVTRGERRVGGRRLREAPSRSIVMNALSASCAAMR